MVIIQEHFICIHHVDMNPWSQTRLQHPHSWLSHQATDSGDSRAGPRPKSSPSMSDLCRSTSGNIASKNTRVASQKHDKKGWPDQIKIHTHRVKAGQINTRNKPGTKANYLQLEKGTDVVIKKNKGTDEHIEWQQTFPQALTKIHKPF